MPPFTTPIALTLFNRPEFIAQTFARIAEVKPTQLFLIGDAPRPGHPTDAEKCAATRAIVEKIDWECEVHRDFSDENLGPRRRLASGISAVFEQVESAIILEHDILAEPSFFIFAQEMLERYQDDVRVMQITGYNPVLPFRQPPDYPYSYYFSNYGASWGWATWRRAWQPYYDVDMKQWSPQLYAELSKEPKLNQTILDSFDRVAHGHETWDYQWAFARVVQSGLSVVSAKNLVRNIGIGPLATNTTNPNTRDGAMTTTPQEFPLRHPPYLMPWPSFEREARLAHYGRHWRNQISRNAPQWLVNRAMRFVRWREGRQMQGTTD